jgi:CRISPR-associated protein Cmr3
MTWIFIEPIDVWLFRDGRPFSAGEGHIAHSIFPPTPMTMQGVLRSLILGHTDVDWIEFREQATPKAQGLGKSIGYPASRGRNASLGKFSMAGPFLARRENKKVVRYTPLPADVVRYAKEGYHFALRPTRGLPFKTEWPMAKSFPLWPDKTEDVESPDPGGWLSEQELDDYLQGKEFRPLQGEMLFESEPRFGIALDYKTRRPVEHMLYQAEFIRLHASPGSEVGLLVRLGPDVTLPADSGTTALGGEARGARYRRLDASDVSAGLGLQAPSERLKLVFLTPAWFSGGWQPADGNAGWSRLLGSPVTLVAAAVGRPQHIGGWDVAARWHKPMYHYVPAGSVYFFEFSQVKQPITLPIGPVTETPAKELSLSAQGFGQVVAGTWEWLEFS